MATAKWGTPTNTATALTTELNSLSNGSTSTASSAYDNETNKHKFVNVEVCLASLTPTGSPSVAIHVLPTLDATNYADSGSDTSVIVLPLTTSTGAKRKIAVNIPVPPFSLKFALTNNSGVSLAASSNTVKYRFHSEDIA
jgi:hypothetical protein